jgi:D-alanyl-D-alanine carboxypeptidase/D-alanyl-D-alanine-endopeptidase (penicillin-binding protein 4)
MRRLILASLTISTSLAAQTTATRPRTAPLRGSLEQRVAQLVDVPPFNRATWGIYVVDDRGRVLYQRNADRFSVPASNTKLVVTAAAAVLLPADYRATTSLYANGRMDAGVLHGDLILYGRGDPTWSARCYAVDTLAPGVCDSTFTAIDAIADSVRAKGIRRIAGKLVGDGSYFEPTMIHYGWNAWDLTWWYAAPVSGLGFHDNSVDFHIDPGPAVDAPPVIAWSPDLGLITFENRARTVTADSTSTIGDNFFRTGSGWNIRAEGTVALGRKTRVESVALPDPNLYAARALAASLARRGVAVEGGAAGTTDSLAYRTVRCCSSPLFDVRGRPLPDIIFPILNSSQNWFAEMLLKILGRELKGEGSWAAGLAVERGLRTDYV